MFASIFLIELILRIYSLGWWNFFNMQSWRWNAFDFLMVTFQVTEDLFSLILVSMHDKARWTDHFHLSAFRVLRVFRAVRIFRLIRIFNMRVELRMLLISIGNSIRSLLWTVIMLLCLTYMVGVYLTQLVTDHKLKGQGRQQTEEPAADLLDELYGTLDRSMLTL